MKATWNKEKRKYEFKIENPFKDFRMMLEFKDKSHYDLAFYKKWGLPRPDNGNEHIKIDGGIMQCFFDYVESEEFKKLESDFEPRPSV